MSEGRQMMTENEVKKDAGTKSRTPEMTPEMLAQFGKKAKEKKEKRSLKGDRLDARSRSAGSSELMSLGEFLKRFPEPAIPIYQRVNGWTMRQKTTFRETVEALSADPKAAPFFIGTVSVATSRTDAGEERVFVIDGQQRFITLSELFPKAFRVVCENRLSTAVTETAAPLEAGDRAALDALFSRIVFVLHNFGEIPLEEQIRAFDELNRHEEAYRLADRYRASMLSALRQKDHDLFSRELDRAWRLSTVLFRLANHEDYELSFDLKDQEKPAERPSLFRLASSDEIAARIAPSGTPRPFIPVEKSPDVALEPLPEPLPEPSEAEREDEEPLVSVRDALSREQGIHAQIMAFLEALVPEAGAQNTSAFLGKDRIFAARSELDFAEHLSTKAKYFAYLCYLRLANPNGRVPVAWEDAFGRTLAGGLEKLLPVRDTEPLTEREARRVLKRLTANNDWLVQLLAAYRGRLDAARTKGAQPGAGETWLAVIRFLGDGWLQLSERGETTFALQMMDESVYFTRSRASQLWHTLETWAAKKDGADETERMLILRARECVLYRALISDAGALEKRIAHVLALFREDPRLVRAPKDEKKAARRIVRFMREAFARRSLPAAGGDAVAARWIARDLFEVQGKVPFASVEKLANTMLMDKASVELLGSIHPDFKCTILEAGLPQSVPWPNTLLTAGIQKVFSGAKTAGELALVVDVLERFWSEG